jgi:enoyl-CoA hydratase/carnithine racemase
MIKGDQVLLTSTHDHVFTMTINREERRNAIRSELMDRLAQEWERFNEDDDLWVARLTGAGDGAFPVGTTSRRTWKTT